MGFPEYYIQQGQVIRHTKDNPPNGLFSLNKFIKQMFTRYNVPFQDECCTADPVNQTVRYDSTAGHLQYFNTTTKVWTNVPNL